ncbi:hypothetical protein OC835_005022 [Tilletia horrida]|uniref:V-type ATPase assembly factor PKR1 n=1 Tax=Tilletia horrida TaxID=155126 RepID=A0AAN6GKF9_9BASI|nr:hypothetical protein OC835_005022 [Tilletia horrida]KAK0538697.1 hypothetical protein OC842_001220 [Tilletia horrida]KAK0564623.1 hypothetical protein OC844_001614 [Tilletia horrida]
MPSTIDAIFEGIMQPGASAPTVHLMNYTFYALFLSLAGLVFLTSGNIHVVFLLAVSVGLWASINWFVSELAKMPAESRQVQQMPDPNAAASSSSTSEQPQSIPVDELKKDR